MIIIAFLLGAALISPALISPALQSSDEHMQVLIDMPPPEAVLQPSESPEEGAHDLTAFPAVVIVKHLSPNVHSLDVPCPSPW